MAKKWQVKRPISEETKQAFPEVNPVVLQLLFNRNLQTQEAIDEFLRSDWTHDVHDPFLFTDMHKAVDRVFAALDKKEKVLVYGDYDADGVTGTAIVYKALKRVGFENIDYYIPHREHEGYGLNPAAVKKIIEDKINLVITVDLGITEIDHIKNLRDKGIDVIIVDHHEAHKTEGKEVLPKAHAIIHASVANDPYPFKHLSGAGTAFKLAQALLDHTLQENEAFEKWLLDLAAIGTMADVVPIIGENRMLLKYGLVVLNKTQNLGLKALMFVAGININNGKDFSSWNISWQLAPRINAAGRLSHAKEALELLLTEDEERAQELAAHLNNINQERQKIAEQIYKEVKTKLSENKQQPMLITEFKAEWPIGLLGLVAGKIANEFYRPVMMMSGAEDKIKGSARSIPEFHIADALAEVQEHLSSYGGHEGAAGFTLEKNKLDDFIKEVTKVAERKLKDIELIPSLDIDMEVEFKDVNWDLAESVDEFEPFGEANPMPLFLSKKLKVKSIDTVGSKGQHLKLTICDEYDKNTCKVIGFSLANGWQEELKIGDKIDIVFELGFNQWNGKRELQIKLKDLKKSYT